MMSGQTTPASSAVVEREIVRWTDELLAQGYCMIPGLLTPSRIEALDSGLSQDFERTPFCSGKFYGERTKRFGRLLTRSPRARDLVMHPLVLAICERVLGPWCDTIQLNLTQALALHPTSRAQFPHRDQDMWRGAIGEIEYLVNVMWPFTRYTAENGATLVWPKSHGAAALDPQPASQPIAVELDPGSALLFLGSTLHGAGANCTTEVRRGAIISYCLGWLKPYENQWLAYPPHVAKGFDAELAALVGYRQHRPNLGNFEGQCPSVLFDEARPEHLAAVDALRPDQEAMLEDYVRAESTPATASVER